SIFFRASRRRHTISKRDWSSDVCSSDLKKTVMEKAMTVLISARDILPCRSLCLATNSATPSMRRVSGRLTRNKMTLKTSIMQMQIGRATGREENKDVEGHEAQNTKGRER